jgi:hypothetical protein
MKTAFRLPDPAVSLHRHHGLRIAETSQPHTADTPLKFADGLWSVALNTKTVSAEQVIHTARAEMLEGAGENISLSMTFDLPDLSESVYVLSPGAVYNGNRFPVIQDRYPPLPPPRGPEDPDQRPRITRVPRLSAEPGPSRLAIPSSDPAVPAIGFWFPEQRKGLWILTPERNAQGLYG